MTRKGQANALMAVVAMALAAAPACDTPGSVAQFCSSAVTTLKTGDVMFDDMEASCERIVEAGNEIGTFPTEERKTEVCGRIGMQAAILKSESQKLSDYFAALNALASFSSTGAQSSASSAASGAAQGTEMSDAEQAALGSIGSFLVQAATSGYQQKALSAEIVRMRDGVDTLLNGLSKAVGVVYAPQLRQERAAMADRYRNFLLEHGSATPDTLLNLDGRWQSDRAAFAAKLQAAAAYQDALATIVKGNDDLAAHARTLRTREVTGLLSPYTTQLNSMISRIQKGF